MALYRNGGFIADPWHFAGADTPLPAAGPVAVDKSRYLRERDSLRARDGALGLALGAGDTLDGIEDDVAGLALVVLRFSRFADGRPYSIARMLRDALGFRGELRAAGDVLRDQIVFLHRAGFDALDVEEPGTIAALRDGRIVCVSHHYQPAAIQEPVPNSGPSWRRISTTGRRLDPRLSSGCGHPSDPRTA
jgi:uncharacterized protein (DUF934 family)